MYENVKPPGMLRLFQYVEPPYVKMISNTFQSLCDVFKGAPFFKRKTFLRHCNLPGALPQHLKKTNNRGKKGESLPYLVSQIDHYSFF